MRILDGGCRVTDLKEGEPVRDGDLLIWDHFNEKISLRVLELDGRATIHNESSDEVLYVIAGSGNVAIDYGVYVPAGIAFEVSGAMTIVSSRCPAESDGELQIVSMLDCPAQQTGDRWYRETIRRQITQFVGSIPPGRAPDHFHLYEEVLCILDGEGEMWAGTSHTPIATGSCVFLPRRQVHCVENRGSGPLRLLGVFYPAGSPAVRYSA